MAINPNTNFTAGQILTADQQNRFPRGVMGYVSRTAGDVTLNTSTVADITGMTTTFTAVANRAYKVTFQALFKKETNNGYPDLYITDGANNIKTNVFQHIAVNQFASVVMVCVIPNFTAGSQTVKVRGFSSSVNTIMLGSGSQVATLIVEDMGPS